MPAFTDKSRHWDKEERFQRVMCLSLSMALPWTEATGSSSIQAKLLERPAQGSGSLPQPRHATKLGLPLVNNVMTLSSSSHPQP